MVQNFLLHSIFEWRFECADNKKKDHGTVAREFHRVNELIVEKILRYEIINGKTHFQNYFQNYFIGKYQ